MATFPQRIKPEVPIWESVWPSNRVSVAQSGRKIIRSVNTQYWASDLIFPPMGREDAQRLLRFYNARAGNGQTYDYPLSLWEPLGRRGGTPRVDATTLAGAVEVPTRGWTPKTNVLRSGDFFRFQHSKVYQVKNNILTDDSGRASVQIIPGLAQTVTSGELLVVVGLTLRCRFVSNTFRLEPANYNYYRCSFRIEEDLQ